MGVTAKKYGISVSFFRKLAIFKKNRMLTPMEFERKFEVFKTRKISYTGALCITYPKYGDHSPKIQNFGQFLP
jgi:hypothetical protein